MVKGAHTAPGGRDAHALFLTPAKRSHEGALPSSTTP